MKKKKKKQGTPGKLGSIGSSSITADGSCARVLRMDVTGIGFYERNPRHSRNPEYDRIKASIREHGMDQPLLITSRPGDDGYFVRAGGNTRLRIMQELYEATGDERYRWADCVFEDWDRESAVLLGHLRENELRGNLTFIDKARAIFEFKNMVAEELGVREVSYRQLEALLRERGYGVSHTLLSLMAYAVSVLLPSMPIAMAAGLGKPQVQMLRNLERVSRDVWQRRELGTPQEFDEIFRSLCARYDGQDWQLESLRQALELELATAADISIQLIRMQLDCLLAGQDPEIPAVVREEMAAAQEALALAESVGKYGHGEAAQPSEITEGCDIADRGGSERTFVNAASRQVSMEVPWMRELIACSGGSTHRRTVPMSALRSRAHTLARRLAERQALGPLIIPLASNGLGYIVRDLPPADRFKQLDQELQSLTSTMWWQLTAFAEMDTAPNEVLEAESVSESIRHALLGDWHNGDTQAVTPLHPARMARRFWRLLSAEDWQDWVLLAASYRSIHQRAELEGTPVWSRPA